MLGIPFYALNFEEDFNELIEYFAEEYVHGRTPNPCVVCNNKLKFGRLVEYADAVGAKYIATGHYARVRRSVTGNGNGSESGVREPSGDGYMGRPILLRACDEKKDQSYVLFGLDRRVLDRVLFPIGHLQKSEVRRIAARYAFPNQDKPDSVEICFVPDRDYARVVRERRPEAFAVGAVLNRAGETIGTHKGVGHYTVGQRRGLGIAAGVPVYVTNIDAERNTVTLGEGDALLATGLIAERVNLLVEGTKGQRDEGSENPSRDREGAGEGGTEARRPSATKPRSHEATKGQGELRITNYGLQNGGGCFRAEVKIRYLHKAAPATVHLLDSDSGANGPLALVIFDEPQRAVTPGQAVVFYDGDVVIGGGWIARAAERDERESFSPAPSDVR
jgi:tRNA-specific 2-thiouridylase